MFVARREIVVLEDDLDGGNADETVKFGLDGTSYEIDLSQANAAKLREALSVYVAGARKATRSGVVTGTRVAPRARGAATADRDQNKAVRAWAKRKGQEDFRAGPHPAEHRRRIQRGGRSLDSRSASRGRLPPEAALAPPRRRIGPPSSYGAPGCRHGSR